VSKYPEHAQEYFYKFASMDTARLILENGTFRYSSPASFNDPFDIQTELYFNFDIADLPHLVSEEVDALVRGRRVASLDDTNDWCKAIGMLKEQHEKGNYKREHLDVLVEPLIYYLSKVVEGTREKYNEYWRELLRKIRVFCVSEHNQSILMWSHYAKYHTGVCFKLRVMSEKDNPLCVAKKVDYVSDPPSFFRVEEWIDSIVLNNEVAFEELYHRYPLTKSEILSYEDEWRVWAPFEEDGNSYIDIPIVEGEIDSIYFGVNADPKLVKDLITIAKARRIERFFRSNKKVKQYGIGYTEI